MSFQIGHILVVWILVPDGSKVSFVGGLTTQKGVDLILEAIAVARAGMF